MRIWSVRLALTAAGLLLLAACGGEPSEDGAAGPQDRGEAMRVAMILAGPVNDGGWNAAHYEGLTNAERESGIEVAYTENAQRPDFESTMKNYARGGYDLVIGNGAEFSEPMMAVAPDFPDTKFVAVFGYGEGGNVGSYVPAGNEIGYLQGVVAGQLTDSNVIGWIGGIEIPSLQEMLAGLGDGVESVNPGAQIVTTYTGNFIDVNAGREAALSLVSQKADVLLAVANGGNVGATQAADEKGAKFVGWPLEMASLAPDAVAVSVVFDIPGVVERIIDEVRDGSFAPEIVRLGVAEGVLAYGEWSDWVPPDVKDKATEVFTAIKDGSLTVPEHLDVYGG